jgi:Uncharacterized protein conserved in bacteria
MSSTTTPPEKKIYFASDLHLGSDIFEDPLVVEKRFVRWLDHIKYDAKALYLLGDIFDFWFEYKYVVPRGFTRFLGKISEMCDSGIEIHLFTGNHDFWFFDYLPKETGVIIHTEPLITEIGGKKFFLAHGDGLGDNSRSFKLIRTVFRNRFCQILFATIHPRWSFGFAHAWSKHSRKKGLKALPRYLGENQEHLVLFSKEYIKKDPSIDFLIFGHRHIMLDLMLNRKSRIIILGDWLQYFSYAVFDGTSLLLDQFET